MALQKDVDALNSWSNNNYLKFNPTKCKFMMLCRKEVKVPLNIHYF